MEMDPNRLEPDTKSSAEAESFDLMKQWARELFDRNRQLEVVNRLGRLMLDKSDLDSRLSLMLTEAAKAIGADGGVFFARDCDSDDLVCRAAFGRNPDDLLGMSFRNLGQKSLAGLALRTGRSQKAENVIDHPDVAKELLARLGVKSLLCVPMIVNDEAFGTLSLTNKDRHRVFTDEEVALVEIVAAYAASAIHASLLDESVRRFRQRVEQASHWACVGELHAGTTHSFGNVMSGIQCALELAAQEAENAGVGGKLAERIDKALKLAKDGSNLVHQLLAFSIRKDTGLQQVSLWAAAGSAAEMARSHPAARERTITNLVRRELPSVDGYPGPLQEIIFTLILNSLQSMDPGGEVRVEAEEMLDGEIELRVVDNGQGMEPDVLSHVFEPFFTTKDSTGLGLPMCAELARDMGGSIAVESELGKGTLIRVRLNMARCMDVAA